ncbi:hypothetical protein MP638_000777 [Amoeboaphelidium occidentale]|nr:hypothetical protein MP638_000777 [Amoeboaphelidium occidentale]
MHVNRDVNAAKNIRFIFLEMNEKDAERPLLFEILKKRTKKKTVGLHTIEGAQKVDSIGLPQEEITKEGETSPPDYLTESDLIALMEKYGIGTDASMAVHMENIVERRYVSISGRSRMMVPTDLAITLIHGYKKIDPDLALPSLRSEMEKQVALVAEGKAEDVKILKERIEIYLKKFNFFVSNIAKMDELFEATYSPLSSTGKIFSKCGRCRRYMHFIALKPQRLHCRTCNETYSLPSGGTIKLFKELKCPLDNFELVLFSTGSKGTGYPVCPNCYNNPPFPDDVKENMSCNLCPHESCVQSLPQNWVAACTKGSCTGFLVLDATSAPAWKLSCNKCMLVTFFNESVHNVSLAKEVDQETKEENFAECPDCYEDEVQTRLINISFGKKANRPDLESVCIHCTDEVEQVIESKVDEVAEEE